MDFILYEDTHKALFFFKKNNKWYYVFNGSKMIYWPYPIKELPYTIDFKSNFIPYLIQDKINHSPKEQIRRALQWLASEIF